MSRTEGRVGDDHDRQGVDTTVQEKAITFPTDAKLANRAREKLAKLANKHGLKLRQGYPRVGKLALMKHQRYAHAKQFKRARRELRRLKTYLRRVIRDIERKLKRTPGLEPIFRPMLFLAQRVHDQQRGQRGPKVYSLHAPEVECIGKGKAHKPYEFGVKGFDRHDGCAIAWRPVRAGSKGASGKPIRRSHAVDRDPARRSNRRQRDRAHHRRQGLSRTRRASAYDMRVFVSQQKRGVTQAIKRELKRRSAVEPVIGHLKSDHRMERNVQIGTQGDAANAVLAAVGYNFARLLAWLRALWRALLALLAQLMSATPLPAAA